MLQVQVFPDRREAGLASAAEAARVIRAAIETDGRAGIVLAAAPSQNEFLAALRTDASIDWKRVTAFHLDEYAGLPASHPASFRRFLRERLIDRVPVAAFHELAGDAFDLDAEVERYRRLLAESPPVLVAMGIGGKRATWRSSTQGNAISTTPVTCMSSHSMTPAARSKSTRAAPHMWTMCPGVRCR